MVRFPIVFYELPELKFLIKKFQIYDLIIRGLADQAKCYFKATFAEVADREDFLPVLHYYNLIFNFNQSKNILKEHYIEMREELFDKVEEMLNVLLVKHKRLIMLKTDGYSLGSCEAKDKVIYQLLECEANLEEELIDAYNKMEIEKSYFKQYEKESLDIQNSDDFDFFETIKKNNYELSTINEEKEEDDENDENNSYNNNNNKTMYKNYNKINYNNQYNINNNVQNNSIYNIQYDTKLDNENINENIKKDNDNYRIINKKMEIDDYISRENINKLKLIKSEMKGNNSDIAIISPKTYILTNDPNLNMNYLEKKVVQERIKNHRYRNSNDFLKHFSPRFMKKENLDKKIIRRFKKYVRKSLTDIIDIDNFLKEKAEKRSQLGSLKIINDSTIECSLTTEDTNEFFRNSIYSSLQFSYEFSTKQYLPPFKNENIAFKSFNTKYLLWLFNDPIIRKLYEEFGEEYSQRLSDLITLEYNLITEEPIMCNQLPYYIKHMGLLYNTLLEETEDEVEAVNDLKNFRENALTKVQNQQLINDNKMQTDNYFNCNMSVTHHEENTLMPNSLHSSNVNKSIPPQCIKKRGRKKGSNGRKELTLSKPFSVSTNHSNNKLTHSNDKFNIKNNHENTNNRNIFKVLKQVNNSHIDNENINSHSISNSDINIFYNDDAIKNLKTEPLPNNNFNFKNDHKTNGTSSFMISNVNTHSDCYYEHDLHDIQDIIDHYDDDIYSENNNKENKINQNNEINDIDSAPYSNNIDNENTKSNALESEELKNILKNNSEEESLSYEYSLNQYDGNLFMEENQLHVEEEILRDGEDGYNLNTNYSQMFDDNYTCNDCFKTDFF